MLNANHSRVGSDFSSVQLSAISRKFSKAYAQNWALKMGIPEFVWKVALFEQEEAEKIRLDSSLPVEINYAFELPISCPSCCYYAPNCINFSVKL